MLVRRGALRDGCKPDHDPFVLVSLVPVHSDRERGGINLLPLCRVVSLWGDARF
jgi:hypothetical protein